MMPTTSSPAATCHPPGAMEYNQVTSIPALHTLRAGAEAERRAKRQRRGETTVLEAAPESPGPARLLPPVAALAHETEHCAANGYQRTDHGHMHLPGQPPHSNKQQHSSIHQDITRNDDRYFAHERKPELQISYIAATQPTVTSTSGLCPQNVHDTGHNIFQTPGLPHQPSYEPPISAAKQLGYTTTRRRYPKLTHPAVLPIVQHANAHPQTDLSAPPQEWYQKSQDDTRKTKHIEPGMFHGEYNPPAVSNAYSIPVGGMNGLIGRRVGKPIDDCFINNQGFALEPEERTPVREASTSPVNSPRIPREVFNYKYFPNHVQDRSDISPIPSSFVRQSAVYSTCPPVSGSEKQHHTHSAIQNPWSSSQDPQQCMTVQKPHSPLYSSIQSVPPTATWASEESDASMGFPAQQRFCEVAAEKCPGRGGANVAQSDDFARNAEPDELTYIDLGHLSRSQFLEYHEMRKRLDLVKGYEVSKLEMCANMRNSVKMNLRGRARLEAWLSKAQTSTRRALSFVAGIFHMDPLITSSYAEDRISAMLNMSNEMLRVCDALMKRTRTKDGRFKWGLLFLLMDRLSELEDPVRVQYAASSNCALLEQQAKDSCAHAW